MKFLFVLAQLETSNRTNVGLRE